MSEFDLKMNRGVMPKDWHQCVLCRTVIPPAAQRQPGPICTDAVWCQEQQRGENKPYVTEGPNDA